MNVRAKIYLWILTLGYSAFIGILVTVLMLGSVEKLTGVRGNSLMTTPALISGTVCVGGIFVLLQLMRVLASIQRNEKLQQEPVTASFFNIHTNFQSLGMGAILVGMLMAFVAYFL